MFRFTIVVAFICVLVVAVQGKMAIRVALLEFHQQIQALNKKGRPGAAKQIPCESHPGKGCAPGVFGNAIAQMHGCCGSASRLGSPINSSL